MLEFLLLGFELGLYVSSEYKTVFGFCMRVLELQQHSLQRLCAARPKEYKPVTKKNKQKGGAEPELTYGATCSRRCSLMMCVCASFEVVNNGMRIAWFWCR